jgi:hypothetical protein
VAVAASVVELLVGERVRECVSILRTHNCMQHIWACHQATIQCTTHFDAPTDTMNRPAMSEMAAGFVTTKHNHMSVCHV